MPEATAPSILDRSRSSNTPNSVFCISIVSASSRLRKVRDRRQLLAQAAVAIGEPQPGRVLEGLKRAALDLAGEEQEIELAQRGAAHRRISRLSSARNKPWPPVWRWPLVMAPSVSSRRAMVERKRFSAFTFVAIGRNSGGCAWLVRLRPAEALDGGVGLPARLQQIVDTLTAVLRREIGVIGAAGAARVGEDEDALLVIHEGLRLGEIGRAGAGLDGETVEPPSPACARCAASGR